MGLTGRRPTGAPTGGQSAPSSQLSSAAELLDLDVLDDPDPAAASRAEVSALRARFSDTDSIVAECDKWLAVRDQSHLAEGDVP